MSEQVKNFIDKLSLGQAAEAGEAFKDALRNKVGDDLEARRKELKRLAKNEILLKIDLLKSKNYSIERFKRYHLLPPRKPLFPSNVSYPNPYTNKEKVAEKLKQELDRWNNKKKEIQINFLHDLFNYLRIPEKSIIYNEYSELNDEEIKRLVKIYFEKPWE